MKVAIVLLLVAVASATLPPLPDSTYETLFTEFVAQYGKTYNADDFFTRYHVFRDNLDYIRNHNAGNSTFTLAINQFGDLTGAEFKAQYTGYRPRVGASRGAPQPRLTTRAAASIDWTAKGVVTPVKNQGQCGSCWAFSTTGSTEAAHAIATGNLVSLSEQQLVDCATKEGNQGCNGGLMDDGFQYIIDNGGLTTEAAYPYTAADGTCKTGLTSAVTISKFVDVGTDDASLVAALQTGPVSVAVEADQLSWQFYFGGVITSDCGKNLDHGVLAVGYGTDNGKDYYKVKNSWGASWGEKGYIRIARGADLCGITNSASYPVV